MPASCYLSRLPDNPMVLVIPDEPGTLFGTLQLAESTRARPKEELKSCVYMSIVLFLPPLFPPWQGLSWPRLALNSQCSQDDFKFPIL